ncbi:MAG: Mrp/NBP35 family ATP-binding protein [Anaerolineales bacterium]
MTNSITKESVLEALSLVQEPELHKDLVTLNMIQDIEIEDSTVSFTIILTTPACPLKSMIEKQAQNAVKTLPGVEKVNIKMGSNVPSDGRDRGTMEIPVRNVVAIASGKGGVGKSTVTVNLAIALAKSGARVGLMDADIYGPNIPTMMGINHIPSTKNNKIAPAVSYGVKIMSMGFLVKPGQPLIWRGPMLTSAIRQFISDVEWGELDYLLVDLPPGTGDVPLSLAQALPLSGVVIVTIPQSVSLEDASRGLEMFKTLDVPILGVVENMRGEIFGAGGGEDMARIAGVEFLGAVPMDSHVRIGGDSGKPVIDYEPESEVSKTFVTIAQRVAAKLSIAAHENRSPEINVV